MAMTKIQKYIFEIFSISQRLQDQTHFIEVKI